MNNHLKLFEDEKNRNKWGIICTPIKMIVNDGKERNIQSIPSPKVKNFKMEELYA